MRTYRSLRCMLLTAHAVLTPHRTPIVPPHAVLSRVLSERAVRITKCQATAGQLQAAALSVRVIYQSASTAPCCVHLVFPLTRSTKQCYDASLKVNSSAKEYERTPNSLHNKPQIILHRFPLSDNILHYTSHSEYTAHIQSCLLYTSPSPRDLATSRMPSSA